MKREIIAGVILVTALLLTACSGKDSSATVLPKVRVETATSADGGSVVEYPGKVKASQDVSLSFRVAGTIARYCVEEGTKVSAGQLLVELDATDYKVQLAATEAEYSQVKAEAERIMALYADSVATPNDNDRAVYGLQQVTAKLQHHRDLLSYTRLYAPFAGTVQKHLFDSHETVAEGVPVISMVGGGEPEVEINIPASEFVRLGSLSTGAGTQPSSVSATAKLSIYPDRLYALTLISVSPKANNNQLYTVRFRLNSSDKPLPQPGANAMVTISYPSEDADNKVAGSRRLVVPVSAVAEDHVMVYDPATSKVASRAVSVVEVKADGSCVVESDAVSVGELIVTSGVRYLSDDEKVELLPAATETNVGGLL